MQEKQQIIVGVDEVGRGPLAGPVIAAAVILHPQRPIAGLADSKKLSEKKREQLADTIKQHAWAWGIGRADVAEIDEINILQASLVAMQRAVAQLAIKPTHALIDGNHCPTLACSTEAVIKGDSKIPAISAASIIAKVARDHEMLDYAKQYPEYGFERHVGYPTKIHLQALEKYGVTPIHRRSYKPVAKLLQQQSITHE